MLICLCPLSVRSSDIKAIDASGTSPQALNVPVSAKNLDKTTRSEHDRLVPWNRFDSIPSV
jgi:hypothetical protein